MTTRKPDPPLVFPDGPSWLLEAALENGARLRCPLEGRALDKQSKDTGLWGHEEPAGSNTWHVWSKEPSNAE